MKWDVINVETKSHLVLQVEFMDGTHGCVRFLPEYLTGVFSPLKEPPFFEKVHLEDGVVTWPGEIDLALDAMYYAIRESGEWLLS